MCRPSCPSPQKYDEYRLYNSIRSMPFLSKHCVPGSGFMKLAKRNPVPVRSHFPLQAEGISNLNLLLGKHWHGIEWYSWMCNVLSSEPWLKIVWQGNFSWMSSSSLLWTWHFFFFFGTYSSEEKPWDESVPFNNTYLWILIEEQMLNYFTEDSHREQLPHWRQERS